MPGLTVFWGSSSKSEVPFLIAHSLAVLQQIRRHAKGQLDCTSMQRHIHCSHTISSHRMIPLQHLSIPVDDIMVSLQLFIGTRFQPMHHTLQCSNLRACMPCAGEVVPGCSGLELRCSAPPPSSFPLLYSHASSHSPVMFQPSALCTLQKTLLV